MVFHWYMFSGFIFRRTPIEVDLPMNTEGEPNLFPTHNTGLCHSFACSALNEFNYRFEGAVQIRSCQYLEQYRRRRRNDADAVLTFTQLGTRQLS
jgi:hypothetical protein